MPKKPREPVLKSFSAAASSPTTLSFSLISTDNMTVSPLYDFLFHFFDAIWKSILCHFIHKWDRFKCFGTQHTHTFPDFMFQQIHRNHRTECCLRHHCLTAPLGHTLLIISNLIQIDFFFLAIFRTFDPSSGTSFAMHLL